MSAPAPSLDSACPCGSTKSYRECCRPLHDGAAATDPEALMRARYCAFCLGLSDYWWRTLHSRHVLKRRGREAAIAAYEQARRSTRFLELLVIDRRAQPAGHQVLVKVLASSAGKDCSFVELASCAQEDGEWRYAGGITRPARALASIPSFDDLSPPD